MVTECNEGNFHVISYLFDGVAGTKEHKGYSSEEM